MMGWPTLTRSPCFTIKFNRLLKSNITVDPIWNWPISSPGLKRRLSSVVNPNLGLYGLLCQPGFIEPTNIAPTSISAMGPCSVLNLQTSRSLRVKRLGSISAVSMLTEKSSPGT